MRTIKFRGKSVNNGEWIYGMPTYDLNYIFADGQMNSPDNYEVDAATVGQFTGLIDKDGKEIFEGDVVDVINGMIGPRKLIIYSTEKSAFMYQVLSDEKSADMRPIKGDIEFINKHFPAKSITIIGNIHDNPELINKGGEE
jgi:uncharacterized phage protein (TIGR01671 family)